MSEKQPFDLLHVAGSGMQKSLKLRLAPRHLKQHRCTWGGGGGGRGGSGNSSPPGEFWENLLINKCNKTQNGGAPWHFVLKAWSSRDFNKNLSYHPPPPRILTRVHLCETMNLHIFLFCAFKIMFYDSDHSKTKQHVAIQYFQTKHAICFLLCLLDFGVIRT